MSLLYYDKAVYRKIRDLYPEVFFGSPEEVFKINAKKHGGKIILPFIAVWRMPDFEINRSYYNDAMVRRGAVLRKTPSVEYPHENVRLHSVPVSLQYQVDVYAHKRQICDGILSELVIEMLEQPWVTVVMEGMGDNDKGIQFHLDIEDSITDNTDISGFTESNRFYRLTATLSIREALLTRIAQGPQDINKIEVTIEDLDTEELYSYFEMELEPGINQLPEPEGERIPHKHRD